MWKFRESQCALFWLLWCSPNRGGTTGNNAYAKLRPSAAQRVRPPVRLGCVHAGDRILDRHRLVVHHRALDWSRCDSSICESFDITHGEHAFRARLVLRPSIGRRSFFLDCPFKALDGDALGGNRTPRSDSVVLLRFRNLPQGSFQACRGGDLDADGNSQRHAGCFEFHSLRLISKEDRMKVIRPNAVLLTVVMLIQLSEAHWAGKLIEILGKEVVVDKELLSPAGKIAAANAARILARQEYERKNPDTSNAGGHVDAIVWDSGASVPNGSGNLSRHLEYRPVNVQMLPRPSSFKPLKTPALIPNQRVNEPDSLRIMSGSPFIYLNYRGEYQVRPPKSGWWSFELVDETGARVWSRQGYDISPLPIEVPYRRGLKLVVHCGQQTNNCPNSLRSNEKIP